MRDPYSERSKRRGAKEAKKSQEGKGGPAPTNLSKGGGKGEGSLTAVRETSFPTFLENKISALDGTNLRRLRDGMGLRPPPWYYNTGGKKSRAGPDCHKERPFRNL